MRYKKYFTSAEIMELYDISERTFRYRINELKEKYKNRPNLLTKQSKKWRIHFSIKQEFQRKK